MENPASLKNQIKLFRFRRFFFGRLRRNPIINWIGREQEKNAAAFNNEDRNMVRNGEYWLMRTLAACAGEKMVAFDVGANTGEWSLCIIHTRSDCEVHAFELVSETYSLLLKEISNEPNIVPNNVGLSNENAEVDVFRNSKSVMSGFFQRLGEKESEKTRGTVIRGDAYVETHHIEKIDFLKIDVEGAEKLVLEGFSETLKAGKIEALCFEYGEFNIASRTLLKDLYDLLEENYVIGRLMPRWVEFSDYDRRRENFRPAYYVAVRKDRTDILEALTG